MDYSMQTRINRLAAEELHWRAAQCDKRAAVYAKRAKAPAVRASVVVGAILYAIPAVLVLALLAIVAGF